MKQKQLVKEAGLVCNYSTKMNITLKPKRIFSHPQLLPAQSGQEPQSRQPGSQPHRDEVIGRSHQRPRPHAVQVASPTQPDQFVGRRGFLSKDTGAGCVQCRPQPPRQATVQLRQRLHQEEPLGHGLRRCVFMCVSMSLLCVYSGRVMHTSVLKETHLFISLLFP